MTDLQARLLRAHEIADAEALVSIYSEAAADAPDPGQRAFFLTQAHVFALEIDHPQVTRLRAALIALGRETPL